MKKSILSLLILLLSFASFAQQDSDTQLSNQSVREIKNKPLNQTRLDAILQDMIDAKLSWLSKITTVSGTTYTIDNDDANGIIYVTNASGCTVTMPASVSDSLVFNFLADSGAGDILFVASGGADLDAPSDTLVTAGQAATWVKINATDYKGFGALGTPSAGGGGGSGAWADLTGSPTDNTDLVAYIDGVGDTLKRYNRIRSAGTGLTQRSTFNLSNGLSGADDGTALATNLYWGGRLGFDTEIGGTTGSFGIIFGQNSGSSDLLKFFSVTVNDGGTGGILLRQNNSYGVYIGGTTAGADKILLSATQTKVDAPFVLQGYATGSLPAAASHPKGIAYDNTTNEVKFSDGSSWAAVGGGGTIPDGDKGDITTSSSGTVWTIDNNVVTAAKLATLSSADLAGKLTDEAGTGSVLFSERDANVQTASYVLVLADRAKEVYMNVATANTVTVPPNSSVAFPVGSKISIISTGAGATSVVAGSGVTINSSSGTLAGPSRYNVMMLTKTATDTWYLWNGEPPFSGAALTATDGQLDFTVTNGSTALVNAANFTANLNGLSTGSIGDLLTFSATNTFTNIAPVTAGRYLRSAGTSTVPVWSTLVLPNSVNANRIVYGSSSNTYGESANLTYDGSLFTVTGGTQWGYAAKTANYTITTADRFIECTANSFTVTLPTAVGKAGFVITIDNSGAGTISIATTGGQTTEISSLAAGEKASLYSNGSGWRSW